jgi:hypothetical protein
MICPSPHPHEFSHMGAAIDPAHDHLVLFGDHVFDGKLWTEGIAQQLNSLPEALAPICLTRQWIVLVVLGHGKVFEGGDIPCVEDIFVIPAHDGFVVFRCHGSDPFDVVMSHYRRDGSACSMPGEEGRVQEPSRTLFVQGTCCIEPHS